MVLRTTLRLRLARNRVLTPPFGGCFIDYVIVRRQRSTRSGYDLRARPNGWPKVARGGGWRSGPYRREQPVRTRTTFGPALAPVRAGCRSLRDHPHSRPTLLAFCANSTSKEPLGHTAGATAGCRPVWLASCLSMK